MCVCGGGGRWSPPLDDQMPWFFNQQTSDKTSIYDKHLNERHFVTLGKHWNLFSARAPPPDAGGGSRRSLSPSRLGRRKLPPNSSVPTPSTPLTSRLGEFGASVPSPTRILAPPSRAFWICPCYTPLRNTRNNTICIMWSRATNNYK